MTRSSHHDPRHQQKPQPSATRPSIKHPNVNSTTSNHDSLCQDTIRTAASSMDSTPTCLLDLLRSLEDFLEDPLLVWDRLHRADPLVHRHRLRLSNSNHIHMGQMWDMLISLTSPSGKLNFARCHRFPVSMESPPTICRGRCNLRIGCRLSTLDGYPSLSASNNIPPRSRPRLSKTRRCLWACLATASDSCPASCGRRCPLPSQRVTSVNWKP